MVWAIQSASSLTEDPWHEIDPCKKLVALAESYQNNQRALPFIEKTRNPLEYQKRNVHISNQPLHRDGSVFVALSEKELLLSSSLKDLGLEEENGAFKKSQSSVDSVYIDEAPKSHEALEKLLLLKEAGVGVFCKNHIELSTHSFEILSPERGLEDSGKRECRSSFD